MEGLFKSISQDFFVGEHFLNPFTSTFTQVFTNDCSHLITPPLELHPTNFTNKVTEKVEL